MKLLELLKWRGNTKKLVESTGLSRQTIEGRAKSGWVVGELDGKRVMYNPKHVTEVGEVSPCSQC